MTDKVNKRFLEFRNAQMGRKGNLKVQGRRREKYGPERLEYIRLKQYAEIAGCKICWEDRAVELCHIVPVRLNGDGTPWNMLVLCPTHHKLFDDGKLNESEFKVIQDKMIVALKYHCMNMPNSPLLSRAA